MKKMEIGYGNENFISNNQVLGLYVAFKWMKIAIRRKEIGLLLSASLKCNLDRKRCFKLRKVFK